jgi:hypothetical protein
VLIPGWIGLALLGLAAFRTWKLLADDTILDRPRERTIFLIRKRWGRHADYVRLFLECPWCAGFWITLAWWGAWQLWPHGTLVAAGAMSLAAIVGLLGHLIADDD